MKNHIWIVSTYILLALFIPWTSTASPVRLTYQGRIMKTDGAPLEYNNVSFIFQITNPTGSCIIYQEQVTGYSMVNSGGMFDVAIGEGTVSYPLTGNFSILDSFNNSSTFTCGSCTGYTCTDGSANYAASSGDTRKLRVQFYDGSGWKTISPDNVIRSVPFAGYALSAQKLGNNVASDFVAKAGLPDCSGGKFLTWNGTALVCSTVSSGSSGTVTNVTGTGPISVATGTTTPVISIATANTTTTGVLSSADWNVFNAKLGTTTSFSGDVSGTYNATSVDKIKGKAVSATAPTDAQFLVYDNGATQYSPVALSGDATMSNTGAVTLKNTGTAGTYTKVTTDAQGRVTSGTTLSAADIPNLDWAKITSGKPTTLSGYGITDGIQNLGGTPSVQTGTLAARPAFGTAGQLYIASDNNTLYRDTGSAWIAIGDGASGGVTSVTASVPLSSSGGATPNLTIAQANTTTSGYLSSTDWNTFNNKLGTATSFSGDVSGAYNATSVDKIKGKSVAPVAYATGQVLRYDGTSWVNALIDASTDLTGALAVANGGTGATTAAGARTNLGLGTAATVNTGSAAGNIPVLGVGGLVANQLCTSDGTASGIICNTTMPTSSQWTTSGSNIYYNTGNVGIGTTNPLAKLQVDGATTLTNLTSDFPGGLKFRRSTDQAFGFTIGSDNNLYWGYNSTSASMGNGSEITRITNGGSWEIGSGQTYGWASTTNAVGNPDAAISRGSANKIYVGNGTTGDYSGTLIAGNVGVGTSSPAYILDILQTQNSASRFQMSNLSNGGSAQILWQLMNDAGQSLQIGQTSSGFTTNGLHIANQSFVQSNSGPLLIQAYGAYPIKFGNNNTSELMRISSSGNVGIGTTSPGAKLEVAGQVKITGGTPGAGKVLTSDAAGLATWETPAAGNPGTVTSVTSANAYLSVATTTSTPVITANVGTAANTLAAGDDARFTDSRSPTGSAGGDLSGTYPNPTVAKVNGNAVASTTPATGQVMRWSGTQYAPVNFGVSHLLSATGAQQFANSSCSASQTLTWSSLTDTFTCANIAGLDAGVITTGTISAARLPASATVWSDGGSGKIYYNGGNVGVGTSSPSTALDVRGQMRSVAAAGSVNSTAGTSIDWSNGNIQISTASCGTFTFSNMLEGGSYTLIVTGATSGTCTFSQSSPDSLASGVFKFVPANAATTASSTTVYTFLRAGNNVYVSWISGF